MPVFLYLQHGFCKESEQHNFFGAHFSIFFWEFHWIFNGVHSDCALKMKNMVFENISNILNYSALSKYHLLSCSVVCKHINVVSLCAEYYSVNAVIYLFETSTVPTYENLCSESFMKSVLFELHRTLWALVKYTYRVCCNSIYEFMKS